MTAQELDEWGADFFSFCARFNDVFGRKESRAQARKYLRGLLSPVPRKNSWQLAEAMGDAVPDPTQRLLYRTLWSADSARNILQKYVIEVFADEDGIGVVDETGFIKKGRRQTAVQRHGGQDRELPGGHVFELCDAQRPRVPGPPVVSA